MSEKCPHGSDHCYECLLRQYLWKCGVFEEAIQQRDRLAAELARERSEHELTRKASLAWADQWERARDDAERLARMLTGWCPDGCKGVRLTDGDLLWSGCECLGEDCDCLQHCYPSEQEITDALAAHEAMGGGE